MTYREASEVEADYAIIGGGVVGLSVAWGLLTRGKRVVVLDGDDGAFRASRGNFGLVWVQSKGLTEPRYARWSQRSAALWADFADLKEAAGVEFRGAFHRFRFGFANANVDQLPADVLQRLMRHQDAKTTRHYVNMAERMRRQQTADRIHVPAVLKRKA